MRNNKQSSIEWFDRWFRDNPEATHEEGNAALQQAKAMHENDMKSFAIKAVSMAVNADIDNPYNLDELYKQTFGGNNE